MKTLRKEKYFNYNGKDFLGVMRIAFNNGRLANQWNPRDLIIELDKKKGIDLKKLQQELNHIQFDLINNYERIVELCGGTGYDDEILVYVDFEVSSYNNKCNKGYNSTRYDK